jgi:predicted DNA-binding transcriptional regulator AlpA/predicted RNase H-like HicB family nuclease
MPKRTVTRVLPRTSDDRIVTTKELLAHIPLTRQTIWRMVREGRFPPPIRLTSSRVGWRWSAVVAWLQEREKRPLASRRYFHQASLSDHHPASTKYLVTLMPDPEEGGYAVGCPALPGCWSQGETEPEALKNIAIAIREYLSVQGEIGHARPPVTVREIDVA